jgi:predicted enzyme related to lactoylglutathione lyase
MHKVRGLGGLFFKSEDPERLRAWYRDNLGVPVESWGGARFVWSEHDPGDACTVWSPFAASTDYFAPSQASFMMNFRVDDLDGMLAQLRAAGVKVDDKVGDGEFGRFGWVFDPDGNKIELWQAPAAAAVPPGQA